MKNFLKKRKKGFTLVEVLLYVSIISVMIPVLSMFLSLILQTRVKNQTIAEVEQNGQQIMQIITQTIRNAKTISSPTRGMNASTLSLIVPTSSKNPTIFSLNGSSIEIQEGTGLNVALSSSNIIASGLNFSNFSRNAGTVVGTIKIQFTLTHVNPSGRNEYDYTKNFFGSANLR